MNNFLLVILLVVLLNIIDNTLYNRKMYLLSKKASKLSDRELIEVSFLTTLLNGLKFGTILLGLSFTGVKQVVYYSVVAFVRGITTYRYLRRKR